jgi:ribosomal protein L44E
LGNTLIASNKRMCVKDDVEKRVSLNINCDACTTLTKKEIQAKIVSLD